MPDVHLVSRPAAGGIKTHLAGLLCDLPLFGWQPILHAPSGLISQFPTCQTRRLEIRGQTSIADIACARDLSRSLRRGSIVHAHGVRAAWICAIVRMFSSSKFNFLVTLHNTPPTGIFGFIALSFIDSQTSSFICVSTEIAKALKKPRAVVIQNGVEVDTNFVGSRGQIRQQLGWDQKKFIVCCVARLSREKGVDILLDAARRLPEILFVVAGDGPESISLKAQSPKNVLFLGMLDDVTSVLYAADCAVFPSRSEGQGIGILEAFAVGTPVVAANVGGIPESVADGETGTLIPSNDSNALAQAITRIRDDPTAFTAYAQRAQEWVKANRRRQTQSVLVTEQYAKLLRTF